VGELGKCAARFSFSLVAEKAKKNVYKYGSLFNPKKLLRIGFHGETGRRFIPINKDVIILPLWVHNPFKAFILKL
jgi:hypothetical protein